MFYSEMSKLSPTLTVFEALLTQVIYRCWSADSNALIKAVVSKIGITKNVHPLLDVNMYKLFIYIETCHFLTLQIMDTIWVKPRKRTLETKHR